MTTTAEFVEVETDPVSVAVIFDAPNAGELVRAYREECLIPNAEPQRATYEAMERASLLKCFGSFVNGELVGFVSVICVIMPHCGRRLATIESLFVDPRYRDTGAGVSLLSAAEQYALESGCLAVVALARVGSAFEKVLSRRVGYQQTHTQHTRWLA